MNNLEKIQMESELERTVKTNTNFNNDMFLLTFFGSTFCLLGNYIDNNVSELFGYSCFSLGAFRAITYPLLVKKEERLKYELYIEPFEFRGFEE